MLLSLNVRDFVIVDQLDLDFHAGFTVLTGETGAGKSIILDALGLLMGDRADAGQIRDGAERAEIAAQFSIHNSPDLRAWLQDNELSGDEDDLLIFFEQDDNTKVIAQHCEDLKDGRAFAEVAKRVSKKKPIVMLKAGRTSMGARAASSHTGALAGNDRIYDDVLRQITQLTRERLRDDALLARYGGEEFAVLLPVRSHLEASAVAERLRQMLALTPCETRGGPVSITVSIGVAFHRTDGTLEDALARADACLYEAKQAGRNRVVTARPEA